MSDNRIQNELEFDKECLRKICNTSYAAYIDAKNTMLELRGIWGDWRDKYEKVDRKLAEIDGRLHVIDRVSKKETKAPDPVVLTIDQIKDIAQKVGIVLDLGEECNFD